MRKFYKQGSSGQILLIVVVVMVVALTIGLSVASRTITNLKLSKQNEDAQKAFQAASAGIDRYINQGNCAINPAACDPTSQTLTSSQFDTKVTEVQGTTLLLNNGSPVDQDRGIDVWLANYPNYTNPYYPSSSGTISIYWGVAGQTNCTANAGNATAPAIQVVLLTGTTTSPVLTKYLYDTCPARKADNKFNNVYSTSAGYNIGGSTFFHKADITLSSGLIMKVIPIYNSAKIAVTGANAFPPQGKIIESVGTAGDTKRKIIYYESYPQIPNEIFPYAILSQ
ncbi:MAG: hypothetical protein KA035_01890 [Candidatus Levybacteria bacterium]|nr:hypothetical protein [Candidatus Levybacteria bacterium]